MIKSRTAQVILTAALIAALGSNAQAQSKEEMHEQLATLHGQIDRIRASAQSPADRDAAIASLQTECASISDALGGDQPVDARNPVINPRAPSGGGRGPRRGRRLRWVSRSALRAAPLPGHPLPGRPRGHMMRSTPGASAQ